MSCCRINTPSDGCWHGHALVRTYRPDARGVVWTEDRRPDCCPLCPPASPDGKPVQAYVRHAPPRPGEA
jgi:hypothetical protein